MVVPYCEFPLALLHFTGSGHMNRSMRSKADKMVKQLLVVNTCQYITVVEFEKICHNIDINFVAKYNT